MGSEDLKKYIKVFLCFILCLSVSITVFRCVATDNPESVNSEKIKFLNFTQRKARNEFEDGELNATIKKIIDAEITFEGDIDLSCLERFDKDFDSVINDLKRFTLESINTNGLPKKYSWYSNGKIDKKALKKRLIKNTKNQKNIEWSDEIPEVVNLFVEELPKCIDCIKTFDKDYDFSMAINNIDNLYLLADTYDEYQLGYFENNEIAIKTDYKNYETIKYNNMAHEIFHLLTYKCNNQRPDDDAEIYLLGTSLNDYCAVSDPLEMRYFSEFSASYLAHQIEPLSDKYDFTYYESFLAESMTQEFECSADDLLRSFISGDFNKLIDLFEPEMQDYKKCLSYFGYLNRYIGEGFTEEIDGYSEEGSDAASNTYLRSCYAITYKNYAIKQLKAFYRGEIDEYELMENVYRYIYSFVDSEEVIESIISDYVNNAK